MPYIAPLSPDAADPSTAATLRAVKAKTGMVPNLYATLAKSPAALNALLQLFEHLGTGRLTAKEREIVALATSQVNGCGYCVSAHTLLGRKAGLTPDQTRAARAGQGSTPRESAIAAFAKALVEERGHVDTVVLDELKRAGPAEAELLEIVANVAAMTLTNYANNVARTEIDFPEVTIALAA